MRKLYFVFTLLTFIIVATLSCNSDDDIIQDQNQGEGVSNPDETTGIEFKDEDISFNLVNLKWGEVAGPNNEKVVYDIYLGDTKIKDSNADTDYTLTQLKANTKYSGRIVPKTLDNETASTKIIKASVELDPILFSVTTKQFADPNAPVPEISNVTVDNLQKNSAILNWDTATISDNSEITYNIYLEGDLVASNLTDNTYSFGNLEPNTFYKGILLAISTNQKSAALEFDFTTLTDPGIVPLTGFTFFRGSSMSHPDGSWIQLIPIFSPANANAVDLNWTSSNESIAVVDKSGYVNTKSTGVTTITATFIDNPNVTQSIELTVTNSRPVGAKFISAQPKRSSLLIGDSKTIQVNKFNIEGGSADDNFVFSSSDTSIASVDNSGKVTGLKEGTVAITVTSTVDATITASVMLRVVSTPIPVTGIFIYGETDLTVYFRPGIGKGGGVRVDPEDATDKTLIWTSTNSDVVSVSPFGSRTTTGPGTASIIVTSASNTSISRTINYTVLADPTSYNETTGVYTAPADSKVFLEIFGYADIGQSTNQDYIQFEVSYSVKNKNGEELLEPWQQNPGTYSYQINDPADPAPFFELRSDPIDFIMPADEEVTIETTLILFDSNVFISLAELIISNSISNDISKTTPLREDQIILF